jgi:putative nucleotidyltransferase with HDIG domain
MIQDKSRTINITDLKEIPTIPVVVARAVGVINNPRSSAKDLTDLIINDQVLAAKILKVANSAYYGLPSKVNNLNRAITLIGFNEVKRMIMPILLLDTFKGFKNNKFFSSQMFWTHSLAVAAASEILTERIKAPYDMGEARVAGLLHDIGRLIIVQYFPNEFESIMSEVELGIKVRMAEFSILGVDHGEVGAQVTEAWNLPKSLVNVIRYHHDCTECPENHKLLAEIVRVGDYLSYQLDIKGLAFGNEPGLVDEVKTKYITNEEESEILLTKLETEVERSQMLLNMIQ